MLHTFMVVAHWALQDPRARVQAFRRGGAVLPFKFAGGNADIATLADGISEEIVTGLSRFSYLRVIARGSTLKYRDQITDLRTIGNELGARYAMEGILRQSACGCVLQCSWWTLSPARIFGPKPMTALSRPNRSSSCRTILFPASSLPSPTSMACCRAA